MSWRCRLAALFLVLGAVVCPLGASAAMRTDVETRVRGIELVVHALVGGSSARSPEKHLGSSPAYDELAPGYSLAAEGAGAVISEGTVAAEELEGVAAKYAASTPQSAIALSKQLASEAQLGEMAAGAGRPIAGPGADAVFRDSARIAQTYGGNAADWAKMSSSGFRAADGTTFATHWVENVVTGAQAEPKVVIDIFGAP